MDRFEAVQNMISMEASLLTSNRIMPTSLKGTIPPGELKTREEVAARVKKDMTASGRTAINFRIKLKDAEDNAMEGLFWLG